MNESMCQIKNLALILQFILKKGKKDIYKTQKVKEIFESDHTSSSMAAYHTDGSFPESFEFDQFSVLLGHSTQFGSP